MAALTLETELKTYEERRAELMQAHEGRFVLIKDKSVLGCFDSEKDAITEGFRQCGYVPFLVKRVEAVDVPLDFSTAALVI